MEREAVLVGIDVGTSKVCALIGEVSRDGRLTIMGHGTVPASGLKKGVVINIDQTVRSIADAVERAERLSGWKIDRAFVGVGGQHVESLNSRGQVAVTAHHREVTREDVNRAIEVARAVSIPSNREVLHVERRGFTVDGQEGVKDPLGMSALRLEVETHIVTASATAVQNLTKCVDRGRRQDRRAGASTRSPRPRPSCPRPRRSSASRSPTSAPARSTSPCSRTARRSTPAVLPVGGNNVTNDVAIGLKTSLQVAEELKIQHGTCDLRGIDDDEEISVVGPRRGRRPDGQPARGLPDHRGPDARDVRAAAATRCRAAGRRHAAGRDHPDRRRGAARGRRRARPRGPPDAGPDRRPGGHRRARRHAPQPGLQHRGRAAPVGRHRASPSGEPARYESAPAGGGLGRLRDALRSIFP